MLAAGGLVSTLRAALEGARTGALKSQERTAF